MTLTTCRECGRQISDQAQGCPGCGCPLAIPVRPLAPAAAGPMMMQPPYPMGVQGHVTIEKTSKPIKLLQLIFALLALIFLILTFAHHPAWLLPAFMAIVGMIVMKIIRWWCHD